MQIFPLNVNAKLPTTAGNSTCESRVFSPAGYGLTFMQFQCEFTSDVIAVLPPIVDIFAEAGSIVIDFSTIALRAKTQCQSQGRPFVFSGRYICQYSLSLLSR